MDTGRKRTAGPPKSLPRELSSCIFFLILGALLGAFSKWMDTLACGDGNLWAGLLLKLGLPRLFSKPAVWALIALTIAVGSRSAGKAALNTFSLFLGMMAGYYAYTVLVIGFVPREAILAWGLLTLLTPAAAVIAWAAKGGGLWGTCLSGAILAFFLSQTFYMGFWYCDLVGWAELVMTALAGAVLFSGWKKLLWSLVPAVVLAPVIQRLLPFLVGGL